MSDYILTIPPALSAETREMLSERLKQKFGISDEMEIIEDSSLIGGFKFNNDGAITDCSVAAQLKEIEKHLTE